MSSAENRPKLLCDLDGTLLDIREKYLALYSQAHTQFNLTVIDAAIYWEQRRHGLSERQVIEASNPPSPQIEAYLEYWKHSIESSEYLAYDRLLIHQEWFPVLQDQAEVYIVTMRQKTDSLEQQLHNLGLTHLIKGIFSRGHLQRALGPLDKTFKKADLLKGLDLRPTDLYLGDTEEDAEVIRAYGLTGYLVDSGMRDRAMLQPLELPIFKDMNDVLQQVFDK